MWNTWSTFKKLCGVKRFGFTQTFTHPRTFLILWSPSQSLSCEIHSIKSVTPGWPLVHRPPPPLCADDLAEPLRRPQQPVRPDAPTARRPRERVGGTTMGDPRRIGYRHLVDVFGRCRGPSLVQSNLDLSSGTPIWPLHSECAVCWRHPTATSLRVKKFKKDNEDVQFEGSLQNFGTWKVTNWRKKSWKGQ